MTGLFTGALDEPLVWDVVAGKILLRVRITSPTPQEDWYLLLPGIPQNVTVNGNTCSVKAEPAAVGMEVGIQVTIAGGNAHDVDLLVFVDVGTTSHSWVYLGVVEQTVPLPTSLVLTATTPPVATLSPTHSAVGAHVSTTGAGKALGVRLGRADVPVGQVTPVGSAVPVQAPQLGTGDEALVDPLVPSISDVVLALTRPGSTTPLGSVTGNIAVDSQDRTASQQPVTTQVIWTATDVLTVVGYLLMKDPTPHLGLDHRSEIVSLIAKSLPSDTRVTLNEMPPIPFGGASPDPAQAAPAASYAANGRLGSLDLTLVSQSQPVSPPPAGGTPPPNRSSVVRLTDVPRAATLHLGQWDPNHPIDTYVDVVFQDQNGASDALAHLTFSAHPFAVPPALPTPGTTQAVTLDRATSTVTGDITGLRTATARRQPRQVTNLFVTATTATALPALLTIKDPDGAVDTVTAKPLPLSFTVDARIPDIAALSSTTTPWDGAAVWKASATVPQLVVTRTPTPNPGTNDQLALTASITDLPSSLSVKGSNDISGVVDIVTWSDAAITSISAEVTTTSYSQVGAPFVHVIGTAQPVPQGVHLLLHRDVPGLDLHYAASALMSLLDVTLRSTALSSAGGTAKPFDHAQLVLTDLPASVTDPMQVDTAAMIGASFDSSGGGIVAGFDVPPGVPALGKARLRVVDDRPSATDGDTFTTPAGVRWVNRPALTPEDLPGSPTGTLLALTLPGLRQARYDGRDGQAMPSPYTICRTLQSGEQALGVAVDLDAPVPVEVELALDGTDTSTWLRATTTDVDSIALDGQLAGSNNMGQHLALELLPRGAGAEALVCTYDRAPDAAPPVSADQDSQAADRLRRSALARVSLTLPDRVESLLAAPEGRLNAFTPLTTSRPPQRQGTQLHVAAPVLLTTPPPQVEVLNGWISGQHGFTEDLPLWQDFRGDTTPRVLYDVRRNTTSILLPGGPGDLPREVHDVGIGPSSLLTTTVTDAVVMARVEDLLSLEISAQGTLPGMGSRRTSRYAATWHKEGWTLPFRAQHRENGVLTADLIEGSVKRLDLRTELLYTPEAFRTENGILDWHAQLQAGSVELSARGLWEHGFPNVAAPTTTPVLTTSPTVHRPEGLTALDLIVDVRRILQIGRRRAWQVVVPGRYAQTDTWHARDDAGTDVSGWLATDRPMDFTHPFATFLAGQVAGHPGALLSGIQGGVRIPDYNQPASQVTDPLFLRPGESGSPHSFAAFLRELREATLSAGTLVDDTRREVPVCVSDDSVTVQEGRTFTEIDVRVGGQPTPALVQFLSWEIDDWQDSPPQDRSDFLKIVAVLPSEVHFSKNTEVVTAPGKRPTKHGEFTVSTGTSATDASGPALGSGTFLLAQLDTSANPFAPVVSTIDATLSAAPGFFRLTTDLFLDVSRFPDNSVTLLEQPGFDALGRFDGGHASTSQLQAWASGQLSGTLMVVSPDFRLSRSSPPNPWKPPHFDLSRLDITITGTPTGPVDLAHAPMALLAAVHDGSGKDANAGLALFARCGALTLDGQIVTSARYGQAYTSTFASPDIDQGADAATLELPNFSGKVCLQKRPGHLLFDGLIAAAGIVGSALAFSWLIGVVGSYAIIELVMLDILEHSSPVRVDDLCSGSYFLTPRPSTELYVFEFVTNGWRHDTEPYNWDLKIPRTALPPLIIAWLLEELGDTFF